MGYLLAKAFSVAHEAIVEGHREIWDAGTATLLGGVLLPLDEGRGPNDPKCTSYSLHWHSFKRTLPAPLLQSNHHDIIRDHHTNSPA